MSRTYTVEFIDTATTKTHTADDVQIKPDSIKFLNGKGAAATVVAYYPAHRVTSVEEVK
jgi:hypothetical protein